MIMCQVVDEPWDVYNQWWGIGKCYDCGRTDRVLYEECGPADWHDSRGAKKFSEHLILNDGVPNLKRSLPEMIDEGGTDIYNVIWHATPEIEDTIRTCAHCLEARRWLEEWCRSWLYGMYREDVIEHWTEDDLYRHQSLARLVVLAKRKWQASHRSVGTWNDPQPLVPVETVAQLVDDSLAWLRAKTGKEYAA